MSDDYFFLAGTKIAKAEKHSPLCLPARGADADGSAKEERYTHTLEGSDRQMNKQTEINTRFWIGVR